MAHPSGLPYPPPSHYFGVPVTTVRRSQRCMTPWPRDFRLAGVIIEALVDPSEYEHLILRPHKLGAQA